DVVNNVFRHASCKEVCKSLSTTRSHRQHVRIDVVTEIDDTGLFVEVVENIDRVILKHISRCEFTEAHTRCSIRIKIRRCVYPDDMKFSIKEILQCLYLHNQPFLVGGIKCIGENDIAN